MDGGGGQFIGRRFAEVPANEPQRLLEELRENEFCRKMDSDSLFCSNFGGRDRDDFLERHAARTNYPVDAARSAGAFDTTTALAGYAARAAAAGASVADDSALG